VIERMQYINLMGRMDDLNRVIERYIASYDIHLEYAARELADIESLTPLSNINPFTQVKQQADRLNKTAGFSWDKPSNMSGDEASRIIGEAIQLFEDRDMRIKALEYKKSTLGEYRKTLEPFSAMVFDVDKLDAYNLISYTFGRMPVSNFIQLEAFLYDDPEILFMQAMRTRDYVWGVYATPVQLKEKIDGVFASLHFERINLTIKDSEETFKGSPVQVLNEINERSNFISAEIDKLVEENQAHSVASRERLAEAVAKAYDLYYVYDTRKFAVKTPMDNFIFVGWMPERDALALKDETIDDAKVIFASDLSEKPAESVPPTRLVNPPLVRNFEFFTTMYGMPNYTELDPTTFISISYTILYGLMFGDFGQGAVLALAGYLLYRIKGMKLGAIISTVGVSSMVFGILYGSVFGFEVNAVWRKPFDEINTTLIIAVCAGAFIIMSTMVLNMLNAVRQRDWGKLLFSPNGAAGFVFYAACIAIVILYINGLAAIAMTIGAIFVVAPLILITFGEPLARLLEKKKEEGGQGAAMTILLSVIELYEALLSYLSNSVSFVRVGAFTLSHAGMMSAVMLMSASPSGGHNIVVVIIGNIIVMVLEGFVVGIQGLRLEFYEMFSRFFSGDGRVFKSYKKNI